MTNCLNGYNEKTLECRSCACTDNELEAALYLLGLDCTFEGRASADQSRKPKVHDAREPARFARAAGGLCWYLAAGSSDLDAATGRPGWLAACVRRARLRVALFLRSLGSRPGQVQVIDCPSSSRGDER